MDRHNCRKSRLVSVLWALRQQSDSKYFCEVENMPLSNLTVASQAELISIITPISYSGFSEMIHVQTSIPAAIAAGVKTSKGSATRCLINS